MDEFANDVSVFDYSHSEEYPCPTFPIDQQRNNEFFNEFLNNIFATATAQGRLPPALPDIGIPFSNTSDPYLMHPFQVSPEIDKILSSLVADPLMDQALYAQAVNGDFLTGGLETKLDSVMVSGPSETELQYYRTFSTYLTMKSRSVKIRILRSHVVFLILREPDAGSTSTYVGHEPNVASSRWGDAGVRRSIREDACSECLHHLNFSTGTGPSGGSIRTREQPSFCDYTLTSMPVGERNCHSE